MDSQLDSRGRRHLYEHGGVRHLCEMAEIHAGVTLVWTLCERDVPANQSFKSYEGANCPSCLASKPN